jgi:acetoin utilization deacetylase AcuC-like enzyme
VSRIRRIRRRLLGGWTAGRGEGARFLYHPDYRGGLTGTPMDAVRGERVLAWILEEGWIRPGAVVTPRPASMENLLRAHTAEYLRRLEDPEEVARIMGLPLSPQEAAQALAMQRLAAGGTIQATRMALRGGKVAFHLGGGFHHAGPERGTGFCLLNDVAVAVKRLRARGFEAPVLVVDLDLHDGNGTRAAFATDPTVHTYSLHNQRWDEVEAVADTSIAFGAGVEDAEYLALLEETLPPVVQSVDPGLVVYVAGVDPAADDAWGDGRLTRSALLERDRRVTDLVRPRPMAVVLAGGYGGSAWRPTARFAAWLLTGEVEEPPPDLEVALQRARRGWDPGDRKPRRGPAAHGSEEAGAPPNDPFQWGLDASDLAALGVVSTANPLLLGRLGVHRIRSDLERFGVLSQLRNRGYPEPSVEVGADAGLGPVLRVWGESDHRHLLVELRAQVDRGSLPGHPLLRVEWLLLQDPRADFTPTRPPLPGQRHPGLGSLADVVAWLVTLCQELELDGIVFRTGHWHVAALARRYLHFLSPEDAKRFARIQVQVQGRTLAEAAATLRPDGAPAGDDPWADLEFVIPVGTRLEGRTVPLPAGAEGPGEG